MRNGLAILGLTHGPAAEQVTTGREPEDRTIGHLILTIAAFGFLGLGIQPPSPEWGVMLVDARSYMQVAPHLVLAPGLAIFGTVLSANLVADGLERWLNPWK